MALDHIPEVGDRYDNRWGSCFTVERVELQPVERAVCRWDTGEDDEFSLSLSALTGPMFIRLAQ